LYFVLCQSTKHKGPRPFCGTRGAQGITGTTRKTRVTLPVPPPPTSPERRLPLRQLTFRATLQCFPPKRGPGEIGRVFPHFKDPFQPSSIQPTLRHFAGNRRNLSL